MRAAPEFSVIIPTIGRPASLRRTLVSLLATRDADCEVIVVDQSGADETRKLIEEVGIGRVRHIVQAGRGRGRAIAFGASRATGDYLAITDDDVLVQPDWLSAAKAAFQRHAPCDAVVGRISPYGARPGPGYMAPQEVEWPREQALSATGLWKGFGANQVFLRKAWDAVGGMDPRLGTGGECPSSDDWDVIYRMLLLGMAVWYSPAMRIWHDGWETKDVRERKAGLYDRARMAAHIKSWAEVGGPALREMTALTLRLFVQGVNHLAHRRRGTAAACFRKCACYLSGVPLGIRLAVQGQATGDADARREDMCASSS